MTDRVISDIHCPHCARRIEIRAACGADRLLTAVMLQGERFGAELYCHHCETGFIYQRLRNNAESRGVAGPRRVPALDHVRTSLTILADESLCEPPGLKQTPST